MAAATTSSPRMPLYQYKLLLKGKAKNSEEELEEEEGKELEYTL